MIRKLALHAFLIIPTAHASISVTDDAGRSVTLPSPARRIVSLAPSITDTLFAAGAGDRIVGTSRFSNYPTAAASIPVIGDATLLDLEGIVALRPDIILVWKSGTPAAQIDKLRRLGIPLFYVETRRLEDIAPEIRRLGELSGTQGMANPNADAFQASLDRLRSTHAQKQKIRVFYQVWDHPLMTIGHNQIIDDAIDLCSGTNIFKQLDQPAATVTKESVLTKNPDVIIINPEASSADWTSYKMLMAVAADNIVKLRAPTIGLPSPSMLPSVDILCHQLDDARQRLHRQRRAEEH